MSDDVERAENEEVEEQTTEVESPTTDNETPQEETQAEEPVVEQEREQESEGDHTRKKNAQSRIKELLKENKTLKSQVGNEILEQEGSLGQGFEPGREYTVDELQRVVAQNANAIATPQIQALKQEIQRMQLESDIGKVQSRYSELNPDSDNYDADLDKRLAEQYNKYGASVPLSEFVEEQMSLASSRAERAKAEASSTLSKQAEEQSLRPSTTAKQEKSAEEMSLSELEKQLGVTR